MDKTALKGVRIADFGHVLAGPYSTMLMGALGAEVIKIETKKRPDEQRVQHGHGVSKEYEASSNFFEINLNKLSVSLDLSNPRGRDLARRIVAISDVALENMRPGVMDKLGLGYTDLVKVKPDIIMVSVSGFGGQGPYRSYTAYNPCFSSFGGQAHLAGYEDGEPNTLTSAGDARAGTSAVFSMLMALNIRQHGAGAVRRRRFGRGAEFHGRRPDDGLRDEPALAEAQRQSRLGYGAPQLLPLQGRR
jgi:benzylsuccinate CoA-transferase BbsF subunit